VRQSSHTSLWKSLERGDLVILSQQGVPCHRGSIDDRTEDGQTIWVTDDIGYRRLFHIEDDYELMIAHNAFTHQSDDNCLQHLPAGYDGQANQCSL
jgi:hypothetical protein